MLTASMLRGFAGLLGSTFLFALVFYLLELSAPAELRQPFRKRLSNLAYTPFVLAWIVIILQPVFGVLFTRLLGTTGRGLLPALTGPRSGVPAQVLFALFFAVAWDVWQYWVHRLQHSVPVLWETHKFHHSDTALNSSSQARHHCLSQLLYVALYLPLLVLFGSQSPHFVAAFAMFRVWSFVNHANLRLDLGPLTPLVSGPQWHRLHHSKRAEHRDKNFAAFFPFIDLLFGTYYGPGRGEYPPTGLPDQEETSFLREATVSPFAALARMRPRPGWIGGRRDSGPLVDVARGETRTQS